MTQPLTQVGRPGMNADYDMVRRLVTASKQEALAPSVANRAHRMQLEANLFVELQNRAHPPTAHMLVPFDDAPPPPWSAGVAKRAAFVVLVALAVVTLSLVIAGRREPLPRVEVPTVSQLLAGE